MYSFVFPRGPVYAHRECRSATPDDLKRAIDNNSPQSIIELLDMGANTGWTYEWTMHDGKEHWGSALHYVVSKYPYRVEMITMLLDIGIDPCGCDNSSETPLKLAIQRGNVDAVNCLLNRGADPNMWFTDTDVEFEADSPLVCAIKWGDMRIVELLIDAGADVDYQGRETPLFAAICKDDPIIIRALIEAGATTEGYSILEDYEVTWQLKKITMAI